MNNFSYTEGNQNKRVDFYGLSSEPCDGCEPKTDEECCSFWQGSLVKDSIAGNVVCCNGRPVACGRRPLRPTRANIKDDECVIEHEKYHFRDLQPCDTAKGCIYIASFRHDVDPTERECLRTRGWSRVFEKKDSRMRKSWRCWMRHFASGIYKSKPKTSAR